MRFERARAIAAGLAVIATAAAGLFWASPAHAAAVPINYSATITIPVPPASSFASSSGGDGWAVAMTPTAVYNVFHHSGATVADCHLQSTAAECTGYPKTITDAAHSFTFSAPGHPAVWLDQATGHLFTYVTRSDGTGGVVCIDTTQPSTNANPFCGFTALTPVGDAATSPYSQISNAVQVGNRWYAFNNFPGSAVTGGRNKVLCFSLATLSGCPSQPYTVGLALGATGTVDPSQPVPTGPIAAIGNQIIIPVQISVNSTVSDVLACINGANAGACTGNWPVSLSFIYLNSSWDGGGAPYPMVASNGVATGFCLPDGTDQCFSLTGASVATPANMTTAIPTNLIWDGPGLTLGTRVYVPIGSFGTTQEVGCYDYTSHNSCVGFPKVLSNIGFLYTVNPDPQRPSCIWVNADSGSAQIQNFDAFSGQGCGQGPIRVLASQFIPPVAECVPSSFTSLQVEQPARSTYTSGSIAFQDGDGNPIPGVGPKALDSTGQTNLSALHLVTAKGLPQFLITLNGEKNKLGQVVVKISWVGTESPECLTQGATAAEFANGLSMMGADGGMFTLGPRPSVGAADFGGVPGPLTTPLHQVIPTPFTGLAANPQRTGFWDVLGNGQVFAVGAAKSFGDLTGRAPATKIVGIAATADGGGYWLAGADGSIYPFGDASKTLGSLAGHHLNAPIVAIVATVGGGGYWLVGADGGVFQFGNAKFNGSLGGIHLNAPIVAAAAAPNDGYVLAGRDGGLFDFAVAFHGSLGNVHLNAPIVAVAMTTDGGGYWMVGGDGGVFQFGDAVYPGSLPGMGIHLRAPIVGAVN